MQCTLVVLGIGLLMLAVEQLKPGRAFERVEGWYWRAIALTVIQAAVVWLSNLTWDRWFPGLTLWPLGGHGLVLDALLGYLALTLIYYWWHRARHESALLWRWLHQIHHSASSIEVLTSFYKHPVELLINSILSSAILFALLGLDAPSSSLAIVIAGIAEIFYHWNVRTPRWLGYLVQRPESHCIHHLHGWHRSNYSDLPLWDIVFGTFENPSAQHANCGFGPEAERRLLAMLLGQSLSEEPSHSRGLRDAVES